MAAWHELEALEIRPRQGFWERPIVQSALEFLGVEKADWTRLSDAREALHRARLAQWNAEAAYRAARHEERRVTEAMAESLHLRGSVGRDIRRHLRGAIVSCGEGLADLTEANASLAEKVVIEAACRAAMAVRDPEKAHQVMVATDTAWASRDHSGPDAWWGRAKLSA